MFGDHVKKELEYAEGLRKRIEDLDKEFYMISKKIDKEIMKLGEEYDKKIIDARKRGNIEEEKRLLKELEIKVHQLEKRKEDQTRPILVEIEKLQEEWLNALRRISGS